jgi:hypothetical protein
MQESRNKRRFILLAVLTAATLVVFWWIQPENRVNADPDIFQVSDLNVVSKIELASGDDTISLAFNGARWRVNDTYDADGDMIRVLFATLQQARPKRSVAALQQDSIYDHLVEEGIRVSLYEGNTLSMQFLAGGNRAKTQAFFADPASEEVYVMAIPGYRVYVSGILELPENGWKDKLVFGFNWRNFRSLRVTFPGSPEESFTVSMGKDHFGIENFQGVDTAKLNTFLDHVSLLSVEDYISEPELADSLQQVKPGMDLLITDIGNRTYGLQLFETEAPAPFLGAMHHAQVATFSRKKIADVWKSKSFFKKK